MIFQTTSEDLRTRARTGILNLNGVKLETPVFMPVGTRGVVKTISADDLEELEYSLILGNTYHLYLRPGTAVLERFGGLRNFRPGNGRFLPTAEVIRSSVLILYLSTNKMGFVFNLTSTEVGIILLLIQ